MNKKTSRRRFVRASAALVAAPYIVPASALGLGEEPAPSERIALGAIGCGWQGPGNMNSLMGHHDCRFVAVCDLDDAHLALAKSTVDKRYGTDADCTAYTDYRELLARPDIDGVMIAVPDHWHGVISVAAAEAGKDIYGEKPLAHTFAEQQAIVAAVNGNGRIWQTGSWQRSVFNFRQGCELVRNGHLGKVARVEVGLPAGHTDFHKTGVPEGYEPPPAGIRYDTWVGPAPMVPYCKSVHHKNWRWNYHFGGGQLMDWIGHHMDIAHWGMNWDATGPSEVHAVQYDFPPRHAFWNTATKYRIECKYEGGVDVVIAGGHADIASGTKWIGENGWVYVDRNKFETSNPDWKKRDFNRGPELPRPQDHYRDFLDCIKSRTKTITPAEVAHRSATPGHLGLISMLTGRKIKWDAKAERIIGDAGATALLGKEMREPYTLAHAFGG